MKTIRLFLAVPLLVLFCGFTRPEVEQFPEYREISSVTDTTLSPNVTAFTFYFTAGKDTVRNDTIRFGYNGPGHRTDSLIPYIVTDARGVASLEIDFGNCTLSFFYNAKYFEVVQPVQARPQMHTTAAIQFRSALNPVKVAKPVIYIYPEKTTPVTIQMDVKGQLEFTYPVYNNGWNFTADPDGTIRMHDKTYDYLFWDAQTDFATKKMDLQSGFVVKKDSLVPFFENKLAAMGLSPREAQDFITYWCPLMGANELNFVHFEFNAGYNQFAEMEITPKPDNLFRVMMVWSATDAAAAKNIKPQPIESVNRGGFTVIEWGGTELKNMPQPIVSTR